MKLGEQPWNICIFNIKTNKEEIRMTSSTFLKCHVVLTSDFTGNERFILNLFMYQISHTSRSPFCLLQTAESVCLNDKHTKLFVEDYVTFTGKLSDGLTAIINFLKHVQLIL